jgi:copper chaperone
MIQFQVNDMTCGHCVATITKAVKALDAGAQVNADLAAHRVTIESVHPPGAVEAAIRAAGYSPDTPQ